MHRSLRVAFAVLAAAFCVSATLNIEVVNSGSTKNDFLTPEILEVNGYNLKYYKIWVPENASSVTVDFTVSDTPDCTYLYFLQRTGGVPCNVDYSDSEYACYYDSFNPSQGTSGGTWIHNAYTSDVRWETNTWWYIAVGRYYLTDYATPCAYTMTATVASCTGTQTATATGSSATSSVCADTATVTGSTPQAVTTSADYYVVRKQLPFNTAVVNVTVAANSANLYIYGKWGGVPADTSSSYQCSDFSSTDVGSGAYVYNMVCITPAWDSYFYVLIEQSTTAVALTAAVDIVPQVCSNSTGGYNCLYSAGLLSEAPLTFSLSEANYPGAPGGEFRFFYVDVNPSSLSANISFTATASSLTGSAYIYWRRNGFVDYSSNTNEGSYYEESLSTGSPTQLVITEADLYPGGRYFFAINAYSGNLTVSLTPFVVTTGSTTGIQTTTGTATATTGTATATTGSTTGTAAATTGRVTTAAATTGDNDSAASVAAASVVAVVVAVFAAMF